jgi:aspartate/methionine/tyrosine aminotransferase
MRLHDFALERFFARWEFTAEMLLCASDVEGWAMSDLLALADEDGRRRWEGLKLGYTESNGMPELRAEIARLYERIEPDDVMVFAGAEECIFALHNVLLGPGDHAIVVRPAYQSLAEVAAGAGAEVTRLDLRESAGWRLDPEEISAALRIGWVATRDRALLARLAAFKDYTTICNSAPSELLALIALRAQDRVLARNRGIVLSNLPLLDAFFERWGGVFEWVRPRGGSTAYPRLLAPVPVDRFAEDLVGETGVLILPGTVFGDDENHFRIGYGRSNLPAALRGLEEYAARTLR